MKKTDAQRIRKLLKGKRIEGVVAREQSVTIRLNDRTKVTIAMEGAPGLDCNWYDWFVVRNDGGIVYRG